MENTLEALQQDLVFYYFKKISDIPRESGNEKAVSDYLKAFALERNLYVRQDEYNNILIKKPATLGYENAPTVIIQGHLDMVCEKNEGTVHDFTKDPIKLIIDGDILRADGTTLGADNGIAVAYSLALLDSKDIPHPPLEIIMTTDEEVGLTGAIHMDVSDIEGQYYINLDSEEEGEIVVSCAGGLRALFQLPLEYEAFDTNLYQKLKLTLKGLKGGHSGMEIDKNRGNANVLMGNVLCKLNDNMDYKLEDIFGGMKDNVIPRESFSVLYVKKDEVKQLEKVVAEAVDQLKNEFKSSDSDLYYVIESMDQNQQETAMLQDSLEKVIFLILALPNGVQTMSSEIPGLVESSINMGRMYVEDNNLSFEFASRSSVKSKKYQMVRLLKLFAEQFNAKCTASKDYPEWPLKKDSKLLELCSKTYKGLFGKEIIVKGIHAGLESGVFLEKLPHLDAVSFGPNAFDVHSPDEHISISSVKRTWQFLLNLLKEIR